MLAGLGELFFLKLFTYGRESMAVGLGSIGIDKNCSISLIIPEKINLIKSVFTCISYVVGI